MATQTQLWVADAHQGWTLGAVLAKNGTKYNVKLDSGEVKYALARQRLLFSHLNNG